MEPAAGAISYTAAETGRALLVAMEAEEPLKLLNTLPRRLEELHAIQGRWESTEVSRANFPLFCLHNSTQRQLVCDIALNQSQSYDLISSGQHRFSCGHPPLISPVYQDCPGSGSGETS